MSPDGTPVNHIDVVHAARVVLDSAIDGGDVKAAHVLAGILAGHNERNGK